MLQLIDLSLFIKLRKIIHSFTDKTIYESDEHMRDVCCFKDITSCVSGMEIAGRGAIVNRTSAVLFKSLASLGVNTHFIRILNMRECVIRKAESLPFRINVFIKSGKSLEEKYGIERGKLFDTPLIEYVHKNGSVLSHWHIASFGWLAHDEIDEIEMFISQTICFLRGMLLGFGMELMEIALEIGREMNENGEFVLLGPISPENISVRDVTSGEEWGMGFVESSTDPAMHYKKIAAKLGIHLGGVSRIIPFATKNNIAHGNTKTLIKLVE